MPKDEILIHADMIEYDKLSCAYGALVAVYNDLTLDKNYNGCLTVIPHMKQILHEQSLLLEKAKQRYTAQQIEILTKADF